MTDPDRLAQLEGGKGATMSAREGLGFIETACEHCGQIVKRYGVIRQDSYDTLHAELAAVENVLRLVVTYPGIDRALGATVYGMCRKALANLPAAARALLDDKRLLGQLIEILQRYCGEAGTSEGAVETLQRKLYELARYRQQDERWNGIMADELGETMKEVEALGIDYEGEVVKKGRAIADVILERITQLRQAEAHTTALRGALDTILKLADGRYIKANDNLRLGDIQYIAQAALRQWDANTDADRR